jgi:acylphosphatase
MRRTRTLIGMDLASMVRRSVTVRGRVQGVGFRWTARREAQRRGLGGFVSNQPDSSVYVEVEGPPDVVDGFIAWLRRGPPGARVSRVDVAELDATGETGFAIY